MFYGNVLENTSNRWRNIPAMLRITHNILFLASSTNKLGKAVGQQLYSCRRKIQRQNTTEKRILKIKYIDQDTLSNGPHLNKSYVRFDKFMWCLENTL